MTEHQHNPLYEAMKSLIDSGRITGVTSDLKLDGIPFVTPEDETYDPTPVTNWREDGSSADLSPYGGRQIKAVEELRAQLLANGDAKQQRIAHALPQYYVNLEDVENFDDKQNFLARQNHSVVYMTRAMNMQNDPVISTMTEYSPIFYKKGTQEPEWRFNLPIEQVDVVRGGSNPGEMIPNHRIAVAKDGKGWTPEKITEWARRWVAQYQQTNNEPVDAYGSGVSMADGGAVSIPNH